MPKQVITRRAADNVYFHPDFHGALSAGIEYLDRRYGEEAVRRYLRQFTASYYAPLIRDVQERGLVALKEHFETVYEAEGGKLNVTFSEDELLLEIEACPAVAHMRGRGFDVARLFGETTRTVNAALCEGTPFSTQVVRYDEETGGALVRFWRDAS